MTWLVTLFSFAFPGLVDFLQRSPQKITVSVRKHRRRGFPVKAYTRQINPSVVHQASKVIADTEYYKLTRTTDRLVHPPGAVVLHSPRFATEYYGDGVWTLVKPGGDIVVDEIRFKKGRRK